MEFGEILMKKQQNSVFLAKNHWNMGYFGQKQANYGWNQAIWSKFRAFFLFLILFGSKKDSNTYV